MFRKIGLYTKSISILPSRRLTIVRAVPQKATMSEAHNYQAYLEVAVDAATAAGNIIASAFHSEKEVDEKKNATDLVTATDRASEELIMGRLKEAFPDHKFIGEEETAALGRDPELTDDPTWCGIGLCKVLTLTHMVARLTEAMSVPCRMCDPLDGTTNFVHSFPFVCVSLGLVIKKEVVVGVVYNPILKELFTAVRGEGAKLNGKPIHASKTSELGRALLATELGTNRDSETMDAVFDRMRTMTSNMRSLRCCGSCALNMCSVACGRVDA